MPEQKKYAKSEDALSKLSAEEVYVTQQNGTERPFTGALLDNKAAGIYVDIVSGEPLFASYDKYDSGSGWPSFTQPLLSEHVEEVVDNSHGMRRVEVRSHHGDSHLGHVFPDGPREPSPSGPKHVTGMRYCINSASLRFVALEDMAAEGYGAFVGLFETPKESA